MEDSYTRLLRAAKELDKGDNPAEVARLLGISDQTIQNWKTRGVPNSKLVKIEEKIGVLPKWIATGRGEMTKPTSIQADSSLTKEQRQMLSLMSRIDKDARDALLKVGELLSRPFERRKKDVEHNPKRRMGEEAYGDAVDSSAFTYSEDEPKQLEKRKQK
ncbi:helix-turn-helix domain-containing protein [Nitrosovibrio sp. Nv6]|uniref:helix-turn-helix domain-containing protein n=1 Tax=Nitrosovibrio sp. Nv6 TaxID=1855340 RepID=UPI0013144770|nr:helix-turn-helix domain-containing protein [Nitrosovibrio sp. Nv6]